MSDSSVLSTDGVTAPTGVISPSDLDNSYSNPSSGTYHKPNNIIHYQASDYENCVNSGGKILKIYPPRCVDKTGRIHASTVNSKTKAKTGSIGK